MFNGKELNRALQLLGSILEYKDSEPVALVVCGGSALIGAGLINRTTKDVDIVALFDGHRQLISAAELPPPLVDAAKKISLELNIPVQWLNNGPQSIFNPRLPNNGLPAGFAGRLEERVYGAKLRVCFLSRFDQIHFKLYAAADRGGPSYHLDDLLNLQPAEEELIAAARWAMTQDPTESFRSILFKMLEVIGFNHVIDQI